MFGEEAPLDLPSDEDDPLSLLLMQKLSRVLPEPFPPISFGLDDPMSQRPKLGVIVAEYISQHSNLETMFGLTFAILMGVEGRTGLSVYQALENRTSQMKALRAIVRAKLRPDQVEIFSALESVILRPTVKDRDRMGHWCWGLCPTLPDALLLIHPSEKMLLHSASLSPPYAPQWNFNRIFVVKEPDLKRALDRMHKAINLYGDFMGFFNPIAPPDVRDRLFQKLSSEPAIREYLDRRNDQMATQSSAQPQSPQPTSSGS
jgi:hypothetical protein